MVKLKHLRHPLQTARTAKDMLSARLSMWTFATHGARRFRLDPRFNLQNVTDGFASRIDDSNDDSALLERICEAYIKAVNQQRFASNAYAATEWWQLVRNRSLGPVTRALQTRDINTLRKMYRNFFRDSCSAGLLGVPFGMAKAYFGGPISDFHRRFYLSHALYRLDYWKSQTNNRFELRDLAGPEIGNPFGVRIDGVFVRVGADYAHCCAQQIGSLISSERSSVAEIGGGFGGMAYYLLRDQANITYCGFDLPESIALASYYLMKAFPHLSFLLYGEQKLTRESIDAADVVLMPSFELANMDDGSIDVTFSSHAMSDLSSEAMAEYMRNVARMTRSAFLYIGNSRASESISDLVSHTYDLFHLSSTRSSGWHSHKISGAGVGGAAGRAASTMFEQCYTRVSAPKNELASLAISR
jgi:putative sugar O-methyltransferase